MRGSGADPRIHARSNAVHKCSCVPAGNPVDSESAGGTFGRVESLNGSFSFERMESLPQLPGKLLVNTRHTDALCSNLAGVLAQR